MKKIIIKIVFCLLFSSSALSEDFRGGDEKFSLRLGSFVYHANKHNSDEYNELFNNNLMLLGVKISKYNEIIVGSFVNSYSDRCALFGVGRNWYQFNDKISFEGLYAYAGEFFLDQFENCGNGGTYRTFDNLVGIGFTPYVYHGIKYKIASIVSVEFGLILPQVIVGTIRLDF